MSVNFYKGTLSVSLIRVVGVYLIKTTYIYYNYE
jgi:hypothetical protein